MSLALTSAIGKALGCNVISYTQLLASSIIKGDLFAMLGSAFYAIHLTLSTSMLQSSYPISLHFLAISLLGLVVSYIISHLSGESLVVFSLDPDYGVFGFFSSL
eukprot:TRINITY_DN7548_c0_g1_i21.p3 TRINITY_DN7548_c0_g1~~TRINITY_DN7548_c0_g1_i21.p3  ORF type:complete len:104 (+),score=21.21 TRINITY_DN7548_c0_g1_i21:720-1031(+)